MRSTVFQWCRLDCDGNIKVGDFGLAEDVYSVGFFKQNNKGNIKLPYKWMALESLTDSMFSEKTDVVNKYSVDHRFIYTKMPISNNCPPPHFVYNSC